MKAIVFDFDGTFANTLPICFYAFQNVFKEYDNTDLSSNEIKEMFGPSEAIYIGDSDADIVAGAQADVFTIGVQWLPEYQTSAFSEQPDLILKSVMEFKSLFKVGSI